MQRRTLSEARRNRWMHHVIDNTAALAFRKIGFQMVLLCACDFQNKTGRS